jgi:hypothetical protein
LLPTPIQDEDLMPGERRFGHDGAKATRFYKPDDGDDQMNEKDEDVVHAGIVSKSQKLPEFQADFVVRHQEAFTCSPPGSMWRRSAICSVT